MLIHELTLTRLLSFGPDSAPLPLRPLNVLIGPNGSGKSNVIEALGLLRSSATDLTEPIRGKGGGGVAEWVWKGDPSETSLVSAIIENPNGAKPLRHTIEFRASNERFELADESIENSEPHDGQSDVYFYYRFQSGHPVLNIRESGRRQLQRQDVALDESILSQRRDPDQYPELAYLAKVYAECRMYREWSFGRNSVFRGPQQADLPNARLSENFLNLGLFLNRLRGLPRVKRDIIKHLAHLYADIDDFDVQVAGGTVQLFLTEGDFTIPANRLSDGTLRYLCLLAILCDPEPPPLVCIEEPELGLHPDMMPKLADLLTAASTRTQLVVTTHSDILVDALSEDPEAIVVVEKHAGQTHARRLAHTADLTAWLEKYRLGQLWLRGELGGTRW